MFLSPCFLLSLIFFFFNDTATTEIYTLSLHDALPISQCFAEGQQAALACGVVPERLLYRELGLGHGLCDAVEQPRHGARRDRKSTRLNSSHGYISYAVFCLKKKKKKKNKKITETRENI